MGRALPLWTSMSSSALRAASHPEMRIGSGRPSWGMGALPASQSLCHCLFVSSLSLYRQNSKKMKIWCSLEGNWIQLKNKMNPAGVGGFMCTLLRVYHLSDLCHRTCPVNDVDTHCITLCFVKHCIRVKLFYVKLFMYVGFVYVFCYLITISHKLFSTMYKIMHWRNKIIWTFLQAADLFFLKYLTFFCLYSFFLNCCNYL